MIAVVVTVPTQLLLWALFVPFYLVWVYLAWKAMKRWDRWAEARINAHYSKKIAEIEQKMHDDPPKEI